ncbi:hypothetical protein EOM57_02050 [Candidatus Saccharibacteria bacterium]|nr:hypothetical protein [Candidatus Saccharibacteria bacterium]
MTSLHSRGDSVQYDPRQAIHAANKELWQNVREHRLAELRKMTTDQLAEQYGRFEVDLAIRVCRRNIKSAKQDGNDSAADKWREVNEPLEGWKEKYYSQDQRRTNRLAATATNPAGYDVNLHHPFLRN